MDQEYYPKGYDSLKVFLYKKVERVSLAMYLFTNHLSDSVSLKTSIRQLADDIIKDIMIFNRGHSNSVSVTKLKEDFLEIRSLISISATCSLVSTVNAHILLDEISKLSKEIENQKDNFIGETEFKKSFFVVESRQKLPDNKNIEEFEHKRHKGQIQENTDIQKKELPKDDISVHKVQTKLPENNSRFDEIMKIIKDNEKVTIKDISSQIKNCSEKTIQRDLLKMVSLNLIKKEGERRWSTYTLN